MSVTVFTVARLVTPVYAAPDDQVIVKDFTASAGWTSVVPINLNGDGLTDFLSYNATTGRAVYSVGR